MEAVNPEFFHVEKASLPYIPRQLVCQRKKRGSALRATATYSRAPMNIGWNMVEISSG